MRTNFAVKLAGAAIVGMLFAAAPASAAVIYSDNFNRANNDTVGSGWAEIDFDNNDVAISTNRLVLKDTEGYCNGLFGSCSLFATVVIDASATRTISTVGYNSISLNFDWDGIGNENSSDFLIAEWRVGSGTWNDLSGTTLANISLQDGAGFLNSGNLMLGAAANNQANIQIRVRVNVNSDNEGAFVDNFTVSGNAIAAPVPEPLTLSLFGAGLVGAAVARRRRKAKA